MNNALSIWNLIEIFPYKNAHGYMFSPTVLSFYSCCQRRAREQWHLKLHTRIFHESFMVHGGLTIILLCDGPCLTSAGRTTSCSVREPSALIRTEFGPGFVHVGFCKMNPDYKSSLM